MTRPRAGTCVRPRDCTITAQSVVLGVGPLNVPTLPKLNGIESFTGSVFHSAQWDRSVDLTGKKIAAYGTGASAIQSRRLSPSK